MQKKKNKKIEDGFCESLEVTAKNHISWTFRLKRTNLKRFNSLEDFAKQKRKQ